MRFNATLIKSTVVGALGGLLFGFDTAVISGTTHALTQTYHLSPGQLGLTVSVALWGTVVGALFSGVPGQRCGGRATLQVLALFYVLSALGCGLAWNWPALLSARFLGGLAIGGSSVLGPVYIAEIAPAEWRGRLVGFFQINVVIGILLAYASNYGIARLDLGAREWRWELGVAGIPAALFLALLLAIPNILRWLATHARMEEALRALQQIGAPNPQRELDQIVRSLHLERAAKAEPLFSAKIPQANLSRGHHWYVQPAFRHQCNSLLSERYFCRRWIRQNVRRPASRCNRRDEPRGDAFCNDLDRPGRPQAAAAGRGRGHVRLPLRCVAHFPNAPASPGAGLAARCVYCVLCCLARRRDLGLHQRNLPNPCARQGPKPRQRLALGDERDHLRGVSAA